MKLPLLFELQCFGVVPKEGKRTTYEADYIGYDSEGLFYGERLDNYLHSDKAKKAITEEIKTYQVFYGDTPLYLGAVYYFDRDENLKIEGFILHDSTGGYYRYEVVGGRQYSEHSILHTIGELKQVHKK